MKAKIVIKPTAHKKDCLLCEEPVLKGEKCLKITQEGYYGGLIVGYVCKKHLIIEKEKIGLKNATINKRD